MQAILSESTTAKSMLEPSQAQSTGSSKAGVVSTSKTSGEITLDVRKIALEVVPHPKPASPPMQLTQSQLGLLASERNATPNFAHQRSEGAVSASSASSPGSDLGIPDNNAWSAPAKALLQAWSTMQSSESPEDEPSPDGTGHVADVTARVVLAGSSQQDSHLR